ncbi:XdhC family protein [Arthrobacter sulfonylureivorans]|uniref:XdhC family protein n=1 Tax=Arthrobacter sulfonylureivorans TaxID=2486855 RepID=A0ABY3W4E6_9MICC|nr:XdhC family protein [Arthrobacter sulfonylureivorans]UNK45074.1 XdhC family protein [Arthrobacter sulfonylureivorans]
MPQREMALAARADELSRRREPFVRATVVRAQHPTSARAGDTALVLAGGTIEGFVGGNCVEASVRDYGLRTLASGEPLLLRVMPGEPVRNQEEGAVTVANPCLSGGSVEIFLQPQLPAPRIVVVGASPIAQALAALGSVLGFEPELVAGSAAQPRPDDAALIVASHGREEEAALTAALQASVPYVALVASERRGNEVLASLDVDEELRSRVHCPAGLALGARTPEETALAILAELVSERSATAAPPAAAGAALPAAAADGVESTDGVGPAAAADGFESTAESGTAEPATALDPVCGMTVPAIPATLHVEHAGRTVYFCSAGCRAAFLKDPEHYAVIS